MMNFSSKIPKPQLGWFGYGGLAGLISWFGCCLLALLGWLFSGAVGQPTWFQLGAKIWAAGLTGGFELGGQRIGLTPVLVTCWIVFVLAKIRINRANILTSWDAVCWHLAGWLVCGFAVVIYANPPFFRQSLLCLVLLGAGFFGSKLIIDWLILQPKIRLLDANPSWAMVKQVTIRIFQVWFALAFLVIVVATFWGFDRVQIAFGQATSGLGETLTLLLVTMVFLPVALIWAAAWVLGTGFGIGNTWVSPHRVQVAELPNFPIFQIFPQQITGWHQLIPWGLAVAVVVLSYRAGQSQSWADLTFRVLGTAGLTSASFGLLLWLSSGGLGQLRLAKVGAPFGASLGWLFLLVAAGMLIGQLFRYLVSRRDLPGAEPTQGADLK